jgi:hypothetical protein
MDAYIGALETYTGAVKAHLRAVGSYPGVLETILPGAVEAHPGPVVESHFGLTEAYSGAKEVHTLACKHTQDP